MIKTILVDSNIQSRENLQNNLVKIENVQIVGCYDDFSQIDAEADLILLSLDGDKQRHNEVRGDTYDTIMKNISNATADNICFYMAINQINKDYVRDVCLTARDTKNVRAVSFNFHTPYPDTKELALSKEEKAKCCDTITQMMKEGAPVFNLKSAFPYLIENRFPTPCHQCVVMENGKLSTCGRCIDVPGLCDQCGYFFVAEYSYTRNMDFHFLPS